MMMLKNPSLPTSKYIKNFPCLSTHLGVNYVRGEFLSYIVNTLVKFFTAFQMCEDANHILPSLNSDFVEQINQIGKKNLNGGEGGQAKRTETVFGFNNRANKAR
jgi:hypothetical protein